MQQSNKEKKKTNLIFKIKEKKNFQNFDIPKKKRNPNKQNIINQFKVFGNFELWNSMTIMTVVCGVWALSVTLRIIHAGGVGKNGSTVAVSQQEKQNLT